jgi:glucosamine-6-phosphate deaminase
MTRLVLPNTETAEHRAAALIAQQLRRARRSVLCLPTGRTMVGVYRELVRLHRAGRADFSRAHVVQLDEFLGVSTGDPRSFRAFLNRHLLDHVNARRTRTHFLNGHARDPRAECRRHDRAIARLGGIDLVVLGLGANGHVGFNEPALALEAATHRTRLAVQTRRANAGPWQERAADVPREALTLGLGTILQSRAILLVATGRSKAKAVSWLDGGRMTTTRPVTLLLGHSRVTVVVDREAAGR